MVSFRFHLYLQRYVGVKELKLRVDDNLKLEEILRRLGVPIEEVGIVVVNGKWQDLDYVLQEEDSVEVFPVYLGG